MIRFTGKNRNKFLELLVVGDISGLPANHARLSTYTNKDGGNLIFVLFQYCCCSYIFPVVFGFGMLTMLGIIDDTVITNRGDHLYVVVNAGCADKVLLPSMYIYNNNIYNI